MACIEPLRSLLQRLELGGDEARSDALLEFAPNPHALGPCVEPQRHRVGGHSPIPPHQHNAGVLGRGGEFIEPGAAREGVRDIIVKRRGGSREWFAGPVGVCLRGSDGGGQVANHPFPGGPAQAPHRLQQGRSLFLGIGQIRIQRREGILQSKRTLGQIGGLGVHGKNL